MPFTVQLIERPDRPDRVEPGHRIWFEGDETRAKVVNVSPSGQLTVRWFRADLQLQQDLPLRPVPWRDTDGVWCWSNYTVNCP